MSCARSNLSISLSLSAHRVTLVYACVSSPQPQGMYPGPNGGTLNGGDPLNTGLVSLWGALRGMFGIASTSLAKGLQLSSEAAVAAEGGSFTFMFMGKDVCVQVRAGKPQLCH
jgi:hypothetical protein